MPKLRGCGKIFRLREAVYFAMQEKDVFTKVVWEEIADLMAGERDVEVCLCENGTFRKYLEKTGKIPFPLLSLREKDETGPADLILGWQSLEKEGNGDLLEDYHRRLKTDGEAFLAGWYSFPTPDDELIWARKCRRAGGRLPLDLPPPGAMGFEELTAILKESPFERYNIRKRGVYYQVICRK